MKEPKRRGTRGQGSVYRVTYKDRHGVTRESPIWHIAYQVRDESGKSSKVRESSGTANRSEAVKRLNARLKQSADGVVSSHSKTLRFETLCELMETDFVNNGRKSEPRLVRLREAFAGCKVSAIDEPAIAKYRARRIEAGATHATVNRELAALRRMFRLGRRMRLLDRVPEFALPAENNARKGFFEEADFLAVRPHLPPYLQVLADVAYATGWRRGELLSRSWRHVDMQAGWLRLEPGETKNGEARMIPITGRLRQALEEQRARKLEVERRTGRIVDALFFHYEGSKAGERVRDIRRAWKIACKAAGLSHLLFHDFRRSTARNLIRAGVPEPVAMKMTGHLTPSVFKRYGIVDESMLLDAAEKLSNFMDRQSQDKDSKAGNITPLTPRKSETA